jgi:glycosyltransferase involved in cell wall biosynthesis
MHIRDSCGIYGAERVILTLGKHIDRQCFDFTLLCMRRKDGRSERLINMAKELNIHVIPVEVEGRFDMRAIMKIRNIIRGQNVSLVNSHDFKSDFYAFMSSFYLPVKRVATAHGSTRDSFLKRTYLYFDEKIIYKYFDSIISVSENLKSQLENNINSIKVTVIQNCIDPSLLEGNGSSKKSMPPLPIPEGHRVFAVIGRLFPDKGHRFFLRAFSKVWRRNPDITGLIIGDGPQRESISRQISELGLEHAVFLCGARSDMKHVYEKIDFLVIPSLTEGLPYVLLEAMANEIPVLATSVGDIPLLIHDEKTGYIVLQGDEEALTKRMMDLLQYPEKSRKMADEGYKIIQEKFTAENMVNKTEELYTFLLSA